MSKNRLSQSGKSNYITSLLVVVNVGNLIKNQESKIQQYIFGRKYQYPGRMAFRERRTSLLTYYVTTEQL